jgi:hypothetical protein
MMLQLLLESAVRVSVLGAGMWGLLRLMRIRNPAQERTAWFCVLVIGSGMPLVAPVVDRLLPVASGIATSVIPALVLPPRAHTLLWAGYVGVVAMLLARIGVGLLMVSVVWRTATPVPSIASDGMSVRASRRVATPVAIGSGVLLPTDWSHWSPAKRAWVLAHERSHLVQHDVYWLLLARVYRAVFWMNPFAWWLVRRLTLLAEQISDDAALTADRRPADYAAVLLEFATGRRSAMPIVALARRSNLSRRVERILGADRAVASVPRARAVVVATVLVIAVLSTMSPWLHVVVNPAGRSEWSRLAPLGRLPNLGD